MGNSKTYSVLRLDVDPEIKKYLEDKKAVTGWTIKKMVEEGLRNEMEDNTIIDKKTGERVVTFPKEWMDPKEWKKYDKKKKGK